METSGTMQTAPLGGSRTPKTAEFGDKEAAEALRKPQPAS